MIFYKATDYYMVLEGKNIQIFLISFLIFLTSCEKNSFEKGVALFNQEAYQEAIAQFTDYIDTHPKHEQSYYNRGRAYEKLGELEKAIEDYQRAVELDPLEITYRMSSGLANFRLKKFGQVVLDMNAVVKKNPNLARAYYIRGRALVKEGKAREALESYNTAINHDADYSEAYLHRGILKVLTKDKSSGCQDLQKAENMGEEEASFYLQKHCR